MICLISGSVDQKNAPLSPQTLTAGAGGVGGVGGAGGAGGVGAVAGARPDGGAALIRSVAMMSGPDEHDIGLDFGDVSPRSEPALTSDDTRAFEEAAVIGGQKLRTDGYFVNIVKRAPAGAAHAAQRSRGEAMTTHPRRER